MSADTVFLEFKVSPVAVISAMILTRTFVTTSLNLVGLSAIMRWPPGYHSRAPAILRETGRTIGSWLLTLISGASLTNHTADDWNRTGTENCLAHRCWRSQFLCEKKGGVVDTRIALARSDREILETMTTFSKSIYSFDLTLFTRRIIDSSHAQIFQRFTCKLVRLPRE